MLDKVRIVKSPLPYGIEKLPVSQSYGNMTINIMLPGGIPITNPENFEETEVKTEELNAEG